jgi:predicted branched-subunit amino acid permease
VFAGSAQFAAVEILGDGGSVAAAVTAGLLLNLRSLAFGVIMAPALAGAWWKRAAWSQWMIDETTAVGSAHTARHLRRYGYLYTGALLFVVWNISTLLGRTALPAADDLVTDLGLDAAIPAVFLALLWPRLSASAQRRTALCGAIMALALVPVAPPGVPIVIAGLAIVAGWRTSAGSPVAGRDAAEGGQPA